MRLDPYGRRFGHGVARLPVRGEPYRVARSLSLREGAALGASEWRAQGKVAVRTAGFAGTAVLAVLMLAGLWTAASDRDPGAVELVAFAEPPPEPPVPQLEETIPQEPIPEVEPPVLPPEPPPPVAKAEPPPPPKAEPVPPKPKPVKPAPPKAKPLPRPKPVPLLAEAKPPPPRVTRPARSRPQPVSVARRPSVEPLAGPRPEPVRENARLARAERQSVAKTARPTVKLAAIASPEEPQEAPRWRSAREAAPARKSAPKPDVSPAAVVPPEPRAASPARRVARTRPVQTDSRLRRPSLSLNAATPVLPDDAPVAATARSRREAPQMARASTGRARNLAMPGQPAPREPAPMPAAPASRDRPKAQARRASSRRDDRKTLRGVPLGSLAACDSDRREDALKQRLIAAVTTQRECTSDAGVYRFLETRNLNAFLMTIERSGSRGLADRCAELSHALSCVTGSNQQSRRR